MSSTKPLMAPGRESLSSMCLNGSLDGAATAVSENQDEGHVQFGDRVFDAALHGYARAVDDVAGHPHHEDVADADIEEDLRRDAGIGTTDDDGFGELPVRQGPKLLRSASGRPPFSDRKAVVAGKQLTQRLVCVHWARVWFLWRRAPTFGNGSDRKRQRQRA